MENLASRMRAAKPSFRYNQLHAGDALRWGLVLPRGTDVEFDPANGGACSSASLIVSLCPRHPLFALLITAVVYLRCIDDAFVFDDEDMILRNRYLGDSAMLWKSFGRDFRWFMDPHHLPQSAYYRPLQDVWMSLNFHLFGLAVPGWHLGLIAIHLVAVWLVFLLARELIANRWAPVVAATLFGLMPVHAQAVVWASAMPLPTGAAFELAGLLCVMRGRRGWALIFCAFALMCHESAVMLPPILFAYAVILEPERDPSIPRGTIRESMWRALAETWPFFVALTGYLLVRLMVFGFVVRSHSANPMTFVQLLTTLPSAIVTYVWLLVAPWSAGPITRWKLSPRCSRATSSCRRQS